MITSILERHRYYCIHPSSLETYIHSTVDILHIQSHLVYYRYTNSSPTTLPLVVDTDTLLGLLNRQRYELYLEPDDIWISYAEEIGE